MMGVENNLPGSAGGVGNKRDLYNRAFGRCDAMPAATKMPWEEFWFECMNDEGLLDELPKRYEKQEWSEWVARRGNLRNAVNARAQKQARPWRVLVEVRGHYVCKHEGDRLVQKEFPAKYKKAVNGLVSLRDTFTDYGEDMVGMLADWNKELGRITADLVGDGISTMRRRVERAALDPDMKTVLLDIFPEVNGHADVAAAARIGRGGL